MFLFLVGVCLFLMCLVANSVDTLPTYLGPDKITKEEIAHVKKQGNVALLVLTILIFIFLSLDYMCSL
jgi:hypothetical protein